MNVQRLFVPLLLAVQGVVYSQPASLQVQAGIHLLNDSSYNKNFLSALNDFLNTTDQPDSANYRIWEPESLETKILTEEMRGIGKNPKFNDKHFYKPTLLNVVTLNDSTYCTQVSFTAIYRDTVLQQAVFRLLAHRVQNQFYFSSPLRWVTKNWKVKKYGNQVFYYPGKLNTEKAKEFAKTIAYFDQKLQAPKQVNEIYCCTDFTHLLQITGIDYFALYNGFNSNTGLSSQATNRGIILNASTGGNFNFFDPHDLWHARLRRVLDSDSTNKPVDEGCAFLYGGSWGLRWDEIISQFKKYFNSNPGSNWLKLMEDQFDFGETPAKRLRINYFFNALLIQPLEKKREFAPVLELLSCGKYEKDNKNYFRVLEKLTGINRNNYNTEIEKLIMKL